MNKGSSDLGRRVVHRQGRRPGDDVHVGRLLGVAVGQGAQQGRLGAASGLATSCRRTRPTTTTTTTKNRPTHDTVGEHVAAQRQHEQAAAQRRRLQCALARA